VGTVNGSGASGSSMTTNLSSLVGDPGMVLASSERYYQSIITLKPQRCNLALASNGRSRHEPRTSARTPARAAKQPSTGATAQRDPVERPRALPVSHDSYCRGLVYTGSATSSSPWRCADRSSFLSYLPVEVRGN